ncbi:2-keto-4-pentenoate hydratase/2-oxohepta-3-ene-1,7-dioic acid hydratase (catechol pathway) [Delftia tsuruhatensis]|uniref:fumarylacetoacetate hydrolase family protein n=1 Tax=Delftia tsuruhatensis TaxID=180282 RepID=UPI001E7E80FA|nr:fumarylacetoacetate hydrolase family protein [Delftia tsuruhatensis]CAB5691326.1 2-keto-4-pentenoate hydratase/2-oxohepta-3-ene-1,7-dioic acid hydratase (catechol pathway) [Delftia tsuruhatensis]CAC9676902.1 2-keto-4-pentenoate hydratase/2-oxohepta-3-ene-1,7-dioic acid hydratase (catechol pathway) [Delftia tsuruhatensis]
MKLATLRNASRDGCLAVVSRDLRRMRTVPELAATMQQALDRWDDVLPGLRAQYEALNAGAGPARPFDPRHCAAPLPRAYQWLDASSYLNHVDLTRRARGGEMPPSFLVDPVMYQGGSDDFMGPCDDIVAASEELGVDLEAEVAVVTGDVPLGVDAQAALGHVRLLGLVNDITLRNLVVPELAKGFGFVQSKPASALSPVLVTPDELGAHWHGGKLHRAMEVWLNGRQIGCPQAGEEMQFHFGQLIAHAARTRRLVAGTVLGSGTVSNRSDVVGVCCLVEARVREQLREGCMRTPFLRHGDRVRIEMRDGDGASLFGAIEQVVRIGGA